MELFEEAVLAYLAGPPQRFVRPQFSLEYKGMPGGSYPDFVTLDYKDRVAYVVEVSAAYNIGGLIQRIRDREQRWYEPLRSHLGGLDLSFSSWALRMTVFVRKDRKEAAVAALQDANDVTVIALDDIMRSWKWNWAGQIAVNPLDRDPCADVDTV
jgi:hypothetical protein